MNDNENKFPDYITFPRTFENYKWYKPLLVLVLAAILYFVFISIMNEVFTMIYGFSTIDAVITGGYEALNESDVSIYYSFLSMALTIPALYIASKIVRDRPFSSYSSSRGGWNWKIYFKCLTIPFAVYFAYYAISMLLNNQSVGTSHISLMAIIIALIIIPAQCIAEEHLFRGWLMQTLGAWFKNPVIAVIIQAVIFGVVHTYNSLGVISVAISGVLYGWLSWKTNGLEASSALHSINNLTVFSLVALGIGSAKSSLSYFDMTEDIIINLVSVFVIYYIGNKKGWFDEKTSDALI